jgi:hypothetical protein
MCSAADVAGLTQSLHTEDAYDHHFQQQRITKGRVVQQRPAMQDMGHEYDAWI